MLSVNGASPANWLKSNSAEVNAPLSMISLLARVSAPVRVSNSPAQRSGATWQTCSMMRSARSARLRSLAAKTSFGATEVGVENLELADFVEIGGRDAAASGAARVVFEDVHAVVFEGEVEQAVADVGNQATLVDREALERDVAVLLGVGDFPEELARVGDHAAADRQMRDVRVGDAAGQEVELEARHRVPRVGAAVDFHHGCYGVLTASAVAEFVDDLENDAAFAFVASGDASIGDELGGKWCEHVV